MTVARQTLLYLLRDNEGTAEVLLGMRMSGMGSGKLMGISGLILGEDSQTDAAIRWARELTSVIMKPEALEECGTVSYRYPNRPEWNTDTVVYTARAWEGAPMVTNQYRCNWVPVAGIPFPLMWDDEQLWPPQILAGEKIDVEVTFDATGNAVAKHTITPR